MNLAEKSGLLGLMAPRNKRGTANTNQDVEATAQEAQAAAEAQAAQEALEKELQRVEHKKSILLSQKEREIQAAGETAVGSFIKNQRVRYFHKLSETWMNDAFIAGVHHDDGVDQPYYTIRYTKPDTGESIEKQTTHDRLEYAEWDEEKTWRIISCKKK